VSFEDVSAKVLVVDDDPAIRRMIARILARGGYASTEAPDSSSALLFLEVEDYSLVTCDIKMPGTSGLELVREIRSRFPDIAVLMISGTDDPAVAAIATELGAYGYVVKPFEINEILIAAANALRRRQLEIENRLHREQLEKLVAERTADLRLTIDRLSRTEKALRESQAEAIRRLAFAAEFHDPTTGAHITRMSNACAILAESHGLASDRVELIRLASPMHDIGKIGVPDEILRKPGKLTPAEMDEMRRHPEIGSDILSGSDSELLVLGGSIALTHHERWDGTGYPRRLAGTQIPVEGRIVAIADVFDALTSERSYKPAYSVEQAVAIMTEERESHFDPDLFDLFLQNVDAIAGFARVS
jgi:putative two-component system response regulator